MNYSIKQTFLSGLPKIPYRNGVGAYEGAVAHETATPEADNDAELGYFQRNWKSRQAFCHFFVDWNSIYQHAPVEYRCWASGNGNSRYVQVELCHTKDKAKFQASYNRYVWLLAKLLFDRKLGVTFGKTLVTHNWVSKNLGGTNHVDPDGYLASHGVSIDNLIVHVTNEYNKMANPPKPVAPKPASPVFGRTLRLTSPMMSGEDVKVLQKRLEIPADGVFGKLTESAVKNWQRANNCPPVDGIVGKITWNALF